jgi:tRNA threonylcarbamoyladenosine biosynthesis protein TsaB
MKTLSFDTSTKFLSVACVDSGDVVSRFHEDVGIRHSEILAHTIGQTIEKAGWKIRDVELVAVGLGPGSFTGLRIAAATVKALAFCLDVKIKGVPTMDAMARRVSGDHERFAPFLDAHKGKVYTCVYERDSCGQISRKTEYLLVTVNDLLESLNDRVFFFGDGLSKYIRELEAHPLASTIPDVDWYPRAEDIALIGLDLARVSTDDPCQIDPMYLHAKECNITIKKSGSSKE